MDCLKTLTRPRKNSSNLLERT